MTTPQTSGWYDDPEDSTQLRYFDGVVWSDHRAPKQMPAAPAAPEQPAAPAPWGAPPQQPGYTQPGSAPAPSPGYAQQAPPGQYPSYPQPGQQPWAGQYPQQQWGQPTLHGRPLAGWWSRVAAFVIDALLVGMVTSLVTSFIPSTYRARQQAWAEQIITGAGSGDIPPMPIPDSGYVTAVLVTFAMIVAYDAICTNRWGRTIGKRLMKLRVVSVERPERLGLGASLVRAAMKYVGDLGSLHVFASMLPLFSLLDWLWPLWDKPLRQSLHDKAAKSAVIRD